MSEYSEWPKCAIAACKNKCCLSLNSIYCWPHTGTGGTLDSLISDLNKGVRKDQLKKLKIVVR